jgi:anti-anti-sigma factor
MQITSSPSGSLNVATLEGRLDTATAAEAEGTLLGLLAAPGLVLDMTQVRYVSSAGLRTLL